MSMTTRKITLSAITAAIVFVVTWTIRIPVPATSGGYINFGDIVIYLSAFLLGGPSAGAAAAVGSALADAAGGAAMYIPATFVIKGIMGLVSGLMTVKKTFRSYALACIISGAVMAAGYGLYELLLFNFAYVIASFPFNMIQWVGSAIIAILLFPVAKRLRIILE
ncbi:MAG: ECF transporter S component [Clostridiales bacterium]|nr:ECF transporter S component [Clostridiales bacterium]